MLKLRKLNSDLKRFDLRKVVVQVVRETSPAIAELNRGQLWLGKRSDGLDIEPEYTAFTIQIKEILGQPVDRVTLKFTGEFWKAIKVTVRADSFTVTSTDSKRKKLEDKYGEEIFGMTEESKREEYLPNYFNPLLKQKIFQKTGITY